MRPEYISPTRIKRPNPIPPAQFAIQITPAAQDIEQYLPFRSDIIIIKPFPGHYFFLYLALPKVLALALAPRGLDNKRAAVNRVDDRVSAGEREVAPRARVPDRIAAAGLHVVAGEDVKVRNLLDLATVGEARDAADVEDAQAGLVVGLEGEAVVHELVMVDHAGRGFVVA